MACSETLQRRPLTIRDLAGALALSTEAAWNQTAADWALLLQRGNGVGIVTSGGKLVASALAHGFGPFGWISMVLVTRDFRRRGLATELLRHCIETLRAEGITPGLDATEAGRRVYEPIGFQPIYGLQRLRAEAIHQKPFPDRHIRLATKEDLPGLADYDAVVFGGDRGQILAHLLERAPRLAFVAEENGVIRGFVLGRDGREATQIGPLIADTPALATALADQALAGTSGPVYIDAVESQAALRDHLTAYGFRAQRGFTRMLLGRDTPFDDPARTFAIAGPELG